jgi:hypothetical protein
MSSVSANTRITLPVTLWTNSISIGPPLDRNNAFASCTASPGTWILSSSSGADIRVERRGPKWCTIVPTRCGRAARASKSSSVIAVMTGSDCQLSAPGSLRLVGDVAHPMYFAPRSRISCRSPPPRCPPSITLGLGLAQPGPSPRAGTMSRRSSVQEGVEAAIRSPACMDLVLLAESDRNWIY